MTKQQLLKYQPDRKIMVFRVKAGNKWLTFPSAIVISKDPNAPIRPETLGRFSGHNDSAGKGIFEGDIIEGDVQNEFGSFQKVRGVMIVSPQGFFTIEIPVDDNVERHFDLQNTKIIGNITDNPELL